jgi:signal transduction histidine kinase
MTSRRSLISIAGLRHVAHRPPLTPRFWLYCAAAYVIPVVAQLVLPPSPGLYDELVWLITLIPAFLLSLHYGLRGAVVGLLGGTILFITVQLALALNSLTADWRITVPIYVAYGALAISVGWLSEELHDHYSGALETERLAAIGQLAVAVRHEVNNALTTIIAESQLLAEVDQTLKEDQRASARSIYDAAQRIAADIRKITNLESAPVVEYADGVKMLDIREAKARPDRT